MAQAKLSAAFGRIISVMMSYWIVLTAATPNVLTWTVPQDGYIIGASCLTDVKTAITVLLVMLEKNGVNMLAGTGLDMNAAAVRTPTAAVLGGAAVLDVNGFIPVLAGDVITVDVDTLTGTSFNGLQVQIDFVAK